jgi:multidrug efflux pump subunit AcrA (membrane-fusion protein)
MSCLTSTFSLSSVASSQSARVRLASKEADLQELAAELKTLKLQLRAKGTALRAQQRKLATSRQPFRCGRFKGYIPPIDASSALSNRLRAALSPSPEL